MPQWIKTDSSNSRRLKTWRIEDAAQAIDRLEAPDPDSGDPENDGRRVEKIDGGWMILNAEKYRSVATREHQRAQTRERVKRHRDKAETFRCNAPVTQCNESVTPSDTEANAEDKKKETKKKTSGKSPELLRIESWFGRRPATTPTKTEGVAWRAARKAIESTPADEWTALERFYQAPQQETYARKSIAVLLNNWQSEIDRAKAWTPKHGGRFANAF